MLGAWAMLRAQRFARQFGPRGMADRAAGLGASLREFAADVRAGMHQREAELRQEFDQEREVDPLSARNGRHHNHTFDVRDIDKDGH
ncbi:MAG TPA: hypothetical protein VH912_18950 [Streptosporangiaceae bacterium]